MRAFIQISICDELGIKRMPLPSITTSASLPMSKIICLSTPHSWNYSNWSFAKKNEYAKSVKMDEISEGWCEYSFHCSVIKHYLVEGRIGHFLFIPTRGGVLTSFFQRGRHWKLRPKRLGSNDSVKFNLLPLWKREWLIYHWFSLIVLTFSDARIPHTT